MGIKRRRSGPARERPGTCLRGSEVACAASPASSSVPRRRALEAPDAGWETVGDVSRLAGASVPLIRRYCDLGLIEYARDRHGRRLFRAGTAARVAEIKAVRIAAVMGTRSA